MASKLQDSENLIRIYPVKKHCSRSVGASKPKRHAHTKARRVPRASNHLIAKGQTKSYIPCISNNFLPGDATQPAIYLSANARHLSQIENVALMPPRISFADNGLRFVNRIYVTTKAAAKGLSTTEWEKLHFFQHPSISHSSLRRQAMFIFGSSNRITQRPWTVLLAKKTASLLHLALHIVSLV